MVGTTPEAECEHRKYCRPAGDLPSLRNGVTVSVNVSTRRDERYDRQVLFGDAL
jgi:hypothetical protein